MKRRKVRRLPMTIAVDGGSGFIGWFFESVNEQLALGNELVGIGHENGSLTARFVGRSKSPAADASGARGK